MLVAPFLLGVVSCSEDFLNYKLETAISAEQTFADTAKINAFTTGLYDNNQFYYYYCSSLMEADIRGNDFLVVSTNNYGRYVTEYQNTGLLSTHYQPRYLWQYAYVEIANCNQALYYLPTSVLPDAYKNRVMAEARGMRATAYLILAHHFAQPYSNTNGTKEGVPLTTTPLAPNDVKPGRGTVQNTYDLILSDLLFAKDNMQTGRTDIMRLTINAIDGFLARTYLDMGNWAAARDNAIAARAGHPLAPKAALTAGFVDATSEWIYAIDMREDDNNGYLMLPSFWDIRVDGYSSFRATNSFHGIFEPADARLNQLGVANTGGWSVTKYLHRPAWNMDQVLMRSAEMFLIEAEACANIPGEEPQAVTALNAVQARAGATLTAAGVTGQPLKDAIALERRKELFAEGFHVLDMLRRGEGFTRLPADHWAPLTLAPYADRFLLPIPINEINTNPNCPQNPGY